MQPGGRILTTHAGSLPRPRSLIELHTARFSGTAIEDAVLAAAVEDATRAIIAKQIEAGLDIVNNGETGAGEFFHLCTTPHGRLRRQRHSPDHG